MEFLNELFGWWKTTREEEPIKEKPKQRSFISNYNEFDRATELEEGTVINRDVFDYFPIIKMKPRLWILVEPRRKDKLIVTNVKRLAKEKASRRACSTIRYAGNHDAIIQSLDTGEGREYPIRYLEVNENIGYRTIIYTLNLTPDLNHYLITEKTYFI